jgi:hypothetical protein
MKPMPIVKPNKPFSTEDEMYGKKMGQMPKKAPMPQKGMTKKMAPMPRKMNPAPTKRSALLSKLQRMGK